MTNSTGLLAKLYDLHAPIRVPGLGEYQYACGEAALEIKRLREGLQLIATDEHRLMNVTARNIAQSILDGKPSGVSPPSDPYANAPLTGPGSRLHDDVHPGCNACGSKERETYDPRFVKHKDWCPCFARNQ